MKQITKKTLTAAAALLCLILATGCSTTSRYPAGTASRSVRTAKPPTGWSDVRFAQLTPGNCQDHAYEYCRRLARRGIDGKVAVVRLRNKGLHAIVETVDKKGEKLYVDASSGGVWYANNYAEGTVISTHAFVVR